MYYDSDERVTERQLCEAYRTELKPCPFCNLKPEIRHFTGRRGDYQKYICEWRIYCEKDKYELKAYVEDQQRPSDVFKKLAARWNTRAYADRDPESFVGLLDEREKQMRTGARPKYALENVIEFSDTSRLVDGLLGKYPCGWTAELRNQVDGFVRKTAAKRLSSLDYSLKRKWIRYTSRKPDPDETVFVCVKLTGDLNGVWSAHAARLVQDKKKVRLLVNWGDPANDREFHAEQQNVYWLPLPPYPPTDEEIDAEFEARRRSESGS